ncbi:hypothetical protein BD309DRAFT_972983 [Dichomitus squalens]|uniref:Uncharacterized protein n=1 Tax=Dichomitus squalens TaxID=114155 RepID=A0A4Q9M7K4_9APHY|nr:hypothetical protein BD311DRAFT_770991 [Dichomitus squalens]TBU37906.1 hypothetical protein BD309DRAFT_972983 [Dichomitus squalens]TBU53348.1 hypothetical protein BD310DRAFT_938299 [Dichomitus squalens]
MLQEKSNQSNPEPQVHGSRRDCFRASARRLFYCGPARSRFRSAARCSQCSAMSRRLHSQAPSVYLQVCVAYGSCSTSPKNLSHFIDSSLCDLARGMSRIICYLHGESRQ